LGSSKPLTAKGSLKADNVAGLIENAFRLVLVMLALFGFIRGDVIKMHQGSLLYHSLMTLAASFVPDLIRKTTKLYITVEFRFMYLIFILMAQFFGEILDFFMKIVWWDKLLHVYSGFIITIIGYIIVHKAADDKNNGKKLTGAFTSLFAFSFSMMFGAMWEIFEYLMDASFGLNMQKSGLVDTMEDLIVCFGSSAVLCIFYIHELKNSKNSLIQRIIDNFIIKNRKAI
jgi:hypothetical protein